MHRIFPFNKSATNIFMLLAITMSYITLPILSFLTVHTACLFMGVSNYNMRFSAATAFLIVGLYSIAGLVAMYISYFRRKRKK